MEENAEVPEERKIAAMHMAVIPENNHSSGDDEKNLGQPERNAAAAAAAQDCNNSEGSFGMKRAKVLVPPKDTRGEEVKAG